MLKELKSLLVGLSSAAPFLIKIYKEKRQDEKILELMELFYLIRDLIKTAEELLELVAPERGTSTSDIEDNYEFIQASLTIQLQRLKRIGDILMDNPTIDLLDSKIKKRINAAIGTKGEGLFGIGSAIFFNQMFRGGKEDDESEKDAVVRVCEEKRKFVLNIHSGSRFSIDEQRDLIILLHNLESDYLAALESVLTPENKLMLSQKAEKLASEYSVRM
jgi:hypothetical protein